MKRPSPIKLRLLAAAAFSMLSGPLSAATINVTVGNSIQAAVNSATAGDEIIVGPGTYNERVLVNKAIKLISSNGREATIIDGSAVASGAQGAIELVGTTDGAVIGETGHGFTLVGFDNVPGSEVGALYVQGTHNNLKIEGNDIVAKGDSALTFQFNAVSGTNILINNNIFSGKTFVGDFPGTGNQFTVPNVARQVIVIGNGPSNPVTIFNLQFTNNQITAISGATQAGETRGNLLATIDVDGVTVTGNTFAGVTPSRAAFRARRPDIVLTGNTFNTTNVGSLLDIQNNTTPLSSLVSANTVTNSGTSAAGSAITGTEAYTTIQAAVNAAIPGATISVTPGIYNERVTISKAVRLISTGGRGATTIDASAAAGSALGAIEVQGTLTGVTIGESSAGFTLIGYDGPPGIEAAALYVKGSQTTLKIEGNDIRANGDSAFTFEYGAAGSGILINDNLFSGKTFVGANPAFAPSSQQFTTANVARQLIVIGNGGGAGSSLVTGVTFSNNRIEAITGGYDTSVMPPVAWGNNVATIDVSNLVLTGNQFVSTVSFGTAFRVRRSGATISGNTFDTTNMGPNTALIITENNTTPIADFIAANTLVKNGQPAGAALTGTNAFTTINAAIAAATLNANINLLAGTYSEYVNVNKAVTLIGAPNRASTVQAPVGAATSAVTIAASNVTVSGLTITRSGNTVATWNDVLSSAGISIQGAFTNARITENLITGMRTGIDINNSSGHTVFRNVLENNHTGMILRNQTDNLLVEQNYIINNRTVGVLFLDAGGAPPPPQQAANSKFNSNDISGNWYGQVVDRQTNPTSLPIKLKDFSGNWFGTATPTVVTANSAEPGYPTLIPVVFGGTASAPGGQPELAGPGSANIDFSPIFTLGTDAEPATYGFQGVPANLQVKADIAVVGAATISNIQQAINAVTSPATVKIPNGTYFGAVSGAGKAITFSIGASPGAIVVNGDFAIDSDDTLEIEIEGNQPGTGYDQYTINGTVSLGGANVVFSGGYSLLETDQILFLVNDLADAVTGTFAGKPNGTVVSFGGGSAIGYLLGTGNDIGLGLSNISVSQGAVTITDGQITPLIDIGTKTPDSGDPSKVFTIQNSGASPVEITEVSAPAAYAVSGIALPLSLEPGQTTTFTVTLTSDTANTHTGVVSITSNEAVGSPFTFGITGFVTPDVVVAAGVVDIQIYSAAGATPFNLTVAVPAAPNDNTYTLTRSSGSWGFVNETGVTSTNTSVLTITKSLVNTVNINDAAGLGTGLVGVTFAGRGSVTTAGIRTFDNNFNVNLDSGTAGTIAFTGNCVFTGTAGLTASTVRNIQFTNNFVTTVVDGDLVLNANVAGTTSGPFYGIDVSGNITSTGSGDITLTGRGGNTGAGNANYGVFIFQKKISSLGTGTIGVTAIGGGNAGSATGLYIDAGGLESVFGAINAVGSCAISNVSAGNHRGVYLKSGGKITTVNALNPVTIVVEGTGGTGVGNGSANYGIMLEGANTAISAHRGTVTVTGTGGNTDGSFNSGVYLFSSSFIASLEDAALTINGIGRGLLSANGSNSHGISINNGSVLTKDGIVTLNGTGGGSGTGTPNHGISSSQGTITNSGIGSVVLTGTAGNGTSNGVNIGGIYKISATSTGTVVVSADKIAISSNDATAFMTLGTGSLRLKPRTAGWPIALGMDDSSTRLGLRIQEFSKVTSGTIIVGDLVTTGSITVGKSVGASVLADQITLNSNVSLQLEALGNITHQVTDGRLTTSGTGNVTIASATGGYRPIAAGNDIVTDAASSLSLASGTDLELPINALTPLDSETGYRKLTVNGGINLGSADLVIGGSFIPAIGDSFPLVENVSSSATTGTFNGLAEGALIPRGINELKITYIGGPDSNDVIVTMVAPAVDVTGNTSFGTTTVGGPITRTLTVTNTGAGTLNIASIVPPAGYTVLGTPAPVSIAPGLSVNFDVRLDATTAGTYNANLVINSNAPIPAFPVALTGTVNPQVLVTGVAPNASINVELENAGGTNYTVTVAVPNETTYTLTRSVGIWSFTDEAGIVTGSGTSTMTITKDAVSNVNITDGPQGPGATGLIGVTFVGRGVAPAGRTFDDSFNVILDTTTSSTVAFSGNNIFTGTAALTVSTLKNATFAASVTTSVENGNLNVEANRGVVASTGAFAGILIQGIVETTGAGSLTLSGRSGDTGPEGLTRGISILSGGQVLSTKVSSTGVINLSGTGAPTVSVAATNSRGVVILGSTAQVASNAGKITIVGDSFGTNSDGKHQGVYISNDAKVKGLLTAEVSINGEGASGSSNGASNYGVFITGTSSEVSVTNAKLTLYAQGGHSTDPSIPLGLGGLTLQGGASIESFGTGEVEIDGFGGAGGNASFGVHLSGSGTDTIPSTIASLTGDISIEGTGGGSGMAAPNNRGVFLAGGALVSKGAANISIIGYEGMGAASNQGFVASSAGRIESKLGQGDVSITADKINLGADVIVDLAGGSVSNVVTFKPRTPRIVGLGGSDTASVLGIARDELRTVISGTVVVGDLVNTLSVSVTGSSGNEIVTQPDVNLAIKSVGDITQGATFSSITTQGTGSLQVTASTGALRPIYLDSATLSDMVIAGPDGLSFGTGSSTKVEFSIKGLTLNASASETGYRRLKVVGGVSLFNSELSLVGSFPGAALGNRFEIINNDLADAIIGNFNGLLDASRITPSFQGGLLPAWIDYKAGDGNDVHVVLGDPDIQVALPAPTGIIASPASVDFGTIAPGNPNNTRTFTITNTGYSKLTLGTLALAGSPAFTVSTPTSTVLQPNATTTFTVTFAPTNIANYAGTLTIPSNDPDAIESPFVINLTGVGGPVPILSAAGNSVLTGQAAPGTDGTGTVGNFGVLERGGYLSENGYLVFPGNLTGPGVTAANNYGLWKKGPLTTDALKLLARTSDLLPPTSVIEKLPQTPAINRTGQVSFVAKITGNGSNDSVLMSEISETGGTGLPMLVAVEGDLIKDDVAFNAAGLMVDGFGTGGNTATSTATSAAGWGTAQVSPTDARIAFAAYLKGPGVTVNVNDTAILDTSYTGAVNDGELSIIARRGSVAPGASGRTFGLLAGNFSDPVRMDEDGNAAFGAVLNVGTGIWSKPYNGTLAKVFVTDDLAPDKDGLPDTAAFSELQAPTLGTNGYMSFRGKLKNEGSNADGKTNDGIWGGLPNNIRLLMRRGWIINNNGTVNAPVGNEPANQRKVGNPWGGWLTRNGSNFGAWRAWIDLDGDGVLTTRNAPENDIHGIFSNSSGQMRLIAEEGDLAPGYAAATFVSLDHPIIGGQNQVAFVGTVGGVVTITPPLAASAANKNNKGIWRQAPNGGALELVIRTGQTIQTSVGPKVVVNVDLPGSGVNIEGSRRIEQPIMDSTGRMIIYVTVQGVSGEETTQILAP